MIISFKLLFYYYCAIFREWEWPSTKMFVQSHKCDTSTEVIGVFGIRGANESPGRNRGEC